MPSIVTSPPPQPAWPPATGDITYRPATPADALELFPRLRQQDRTELLKSSGDDTSAILVKSVVVSEEAWTATNAQGELLGIFGVARYGSLGAVWMLAADAVSGHAMELVRDGRGWIKSIESRFERLCNFVSADNDAAIAWLLSLGFNLGEVIPEHGAAKAPFRLFFKDADHV